MINQVGNILIGKLTTLPFLDKYTGVVKPITILDKNTNGSTIRKVFPASCQTTLTDCDSGRYKDLLPDDSKKSVLFLKDTGLRLTARQGNYLYFSATYDLVCWLNMPKLGFSDCSYSGIAIASILKLLPERPFNSGNYHLVNIQFQGQRPKSVNPFAEYTIDEAITQYLLYPFDYFVLSFQVDFRFDLRCLEVEPIGAELDCVTK